MDALIDTELVLLDMDAATKEAVIDELALLLASKNRLAGKAEYVAKVLERESLFSTAVGSGVAIPHGKSAAVVRTSIAVGRLKRPIQWSEGEDVQVVFLLAVPEIEARDTHLRILAQLSRRIMGDNFCKKLLSVPTKAELVELVTAAEG